MSENINESKTRDWWEMPAAHVLAHFTTAEMHAIKPKNGMLIYNITEDWPFIYARGEWCGLVLGH